jgi:hypothetical protein
MNYISSDDEVETAEDSDYSEDTKSNVFKRCVFTPSAAPDTSAEVSVGYEEHEENDDSSDDNVESVSSKSDSETDLIVL